MVDNIGGIKRTLFGERGGRLRAAGGGLVWFGLENESKKLSNQTPKKKKNEGQFTNEPPRLKIGKNFL